MRRRASIEIKDADQLALMRQAGLVVERGLAAMAAVAAPGVSTLDLDAVARDVLREAGATPNFLNYHGYPATICASVNDRVVHGIPSAAETLRDGDLLSIDFGAIVEGWHGDSAVTVGIGSVRPEVARLSQVCRDAMWAGIGAARIGGRVSDIGAAVSASVRAAGDYGIVSGYGGHGIGTAMHMDPHVPNEGRPGQGPKLVDGMVLAIEPMITLGTSDTVVLDDDWTITTTDGSWAAHWEHTVAILDDGPWVLTATDGGRAELAARGVAVSALAA